MARLLTLAALILAAPVVAQDHTSAIRWVDTGYVTSGDVRTVEIVFQLDEMPSDEALPALAAALCEAHAAQALDHIEDVLLVTDPDRVAIVLRAQKTKFLWIKTGIYRRIAFDHVGGTCFDTPAAAE